MGVGGGWGVGGCGWGGLGGRWMGVGGGWGVPPTYVHTHAHTCRHAHACTHVQACTFTCGKHDNFMQMADPIGGIPGNSL